MDIEQKRERLAQVSAEARRIYKAAEDADRDLTQEEAGELDRLLTEAETLRRKVQAQELDDWLSQPQPRKVHPPKPVNLDTPTEYYQPTAIPWRPKSDVHVLNRGEKLTDRLGAKTDMTFGGFLRAAVLGTGEGSLYRNTMLESTDSSGGYTVPSILTAQLIDRLRAQSVLMRAGATTMVLPDGGEVSMAKLTGDPTASWHRESTSITASTPTFGRVTFQPRTLVSMVKASRELLSDSINAEEALLNAFSQALALKVDRAGLLGDGSAGEPLGVAGTSGIGDVDMGTNGAALSNYAPFVNVVYQLTQDNANEPTGFIMNPRTYTAAANLLDSQNQPMMKPEAITNIPMLQTTQVPIDDTQGTSTDASKVYAGYWPDLVWGVRHELQVEILRETYASTFEYAFLAHLRGDWVVRHPESFATITGIVPS